MCGIVGYADYRSSVDPRTHPATVRRMLSMISHRGPDDEGIWSKPSLGLVLGHRRLSILDLSPQGHQPMMSRCERFVVAFNGEIYNYRELRAELAEHTGCQLEDSCSDTRVLVESISAFGLEPTLQKLNGMFAFAVWDQSTHELSLVRDRMGEKPLYYGISQGVLLFGSELKALRAHPQWHAEINRTALELFLRYKYIPGPHSIYQGILKLPPASLLTIKIAPQGFPVGVELPLPQTYWSISECARAGQQAPFCGSERDAVDALDRRLRESVRLRMVADVPLGAFLSGGIDSSTVVSLMQSQSAKPVKTFSIGFHDDALNEAVYAKEVATHLHSDHTEFYVTAEDALQVIPQLPAIYDEPFADSSQIPTYLVSQLARRQVTVALSGDGGDELFAGYTRYARTSRSWRQVASVPRSLRSLLAKLATPASQVSVCPARVVRLLQAFRANGALEFYQQCVSQWRSQAPLVLHAEGPFDLPSVGGTTLLDELTHQMMLFDTGSYLPDDILVKVDRASMAVGLESRLPLLDHHLVEFAWTLPMSFKVHGNSKKWVLRRVLDRYIPAHLIDRPKRGFGIPLSDWLRGPLREWSEELLGEGRLNNEGFFDARQVRKLWTDHLHGQEQVGELVWAFLMFQAWRDAEAKMSFDMECRAKCA